MKILALLNGILGFIGLWAPETLSNNRWKRYAYHLLTAFVLFVMYSFMASQLVAVIIHLFEYKTISETLYLLLSVINVCYKAVAFLLKKQDIIRLTNMLREYHCVPKDAAERAIQKKFDRVSRFITGLYVVMVYNCALLMAIAPLFQKSDKPILPFETWLPYGLHNSYVYWLSYAHQTFGLFFCASVCLATDNIIMCFVWQACAQFDILEHRIKTLPALVQDVRSQMSCRLTNDFEKITFIRHIQHHEYIYRYANNLMTTFSSIIFVQFCTSSLVITVSVFQLSITSTTNVNFVKVLLYLMCMLVEFLAYCWFGNELHFKSTEFADNVYKSNWVALNLQSWKMLLFLIRRCSKPIVISCYNMVVLSLETFVQILKLSYSAYNVLRETKAN